MSFNCGPITILLSQTNSSNCKNGCCWNSVSEYDWNLFPNCNCRKLSGTRCQRRNYIWFVVRFTWWVDILEINSSIQPFNSCRIRRDINLEIQLKKRLICCKDSPFFNGTIATQRVLCLINIVWHFGSHLNKSVIRKWAVVECNNQNVKKKIFSAL